MAVALNDILEIKLRQTYLTRECNNIFYYKVFSLTGTPTYDEIADAWALAVLDKINAVQVAGVSNVDITIKNLTNALDITTVSNVATGDVAAEGFPAFVAWGFQLVRTTALTRHGSKRVVGVPETWVNGETPTASFTTPRDDLETALGAVVSVDGATGDCNLRHMIVKRVFNETEQEYELDISQLNVVSEAVFKKVTSQVSRKD